MGALIILMLHLSTAPLAAEAPPTGVVPRLGFIGNADPQSQALALDAFRQGLRDLGWSERQNLRIEYR
jgi:hypothetical protein